MKEGGREDKTREGKREEKVKIIIEFLNSLVCFEGDLWFSEKKGNHVQKCCIIIFVSHSLCSVW